ncbi:hypothetical protein FB45DRAFT_873373 [Roridomyces roridus]|uniref:Uncharacterized protein n=1 Tax=Roridomyces roridus TaxID=1738132 RepID=A0AAD7BC06_9AGAR|nr:hypothetical protein FB45DRAFT_873373 [Roridomyces roridus]
MDFGADNGRTNGPYSKRAYKEVDRGGHSRSIGLQRKTSMKPFAGASIPPGSLNQTYKYLLVTDTSLKNAPGFREEEWSLLDVFNRARYRGPAATPAVTDSGVAHGDRYGLQPSQNDDQPTHHGDVIGITLCILVKIHAWVGIFESLGQLGCQRDILACVRGEFERPHFEYALATAAAPRPVALPLIDGSSSSALDGENGDCKGSEDGKERYEYLKPSLCTTLLWDNSGESQLFVTVNANCMRVDPPAINKLDASFDSSSTVKTGTWKLPHPTSSI